MAMKDLDCYGIEGLTEEERDRAFASLQIAAWMGLIPSPAMEAVEERRRQKNQEIERRLAQGEAVYGPTRYTPAMYLQYELTRFKLAYTVFAGKSVGGYVCQEITEEQKRAFYEENRDLFTRSAGDSFAYGEVSMIIEKRIREQEYENIIQDLLR